MGPNYFQRCWCFRNKMLPSSFLNSRNYTCFMNYIFPEENAVRKGKPLLRKDLSLFSEFMISRSAPPLFPAIYSQNFLRDNPQAVLSSTPFCVWYSRLRH